MKDLVALVADGTMRSVLNNLLARDKAFGIRKIQIEIFVHPHHDPGVYNDAGSFLSPFTINYKYALVLFDREGCGQENKSSIELQSIVQKQVNIHGWEHRSGVIVLDPELESWVWTRSHHVSRVLDIEKQELLELLQGDDPNCQKPSHPKELMEKILQRSRIPRSSALYEDLAKSVSFKRCSDPSFQQLKHNLIEWFGIKL